MLISKSLLGCLLFVLPVISGPIVQIREPSVTLPFVRKLNFSGSTIADIDRARAARIGSEGGNAKRASSFSVTNTAVTYVANVGVGTPPTTYSLLIDTGSSNTWVGARALKPYIPTSSTRLTGDLVSVTYGSGSFAGLECRSLCGHYSLSLRANSLHARHRHCHIGFIACNPQPVYRGGPSLPKAFLESTEFWALGLRTSQPAR